MNSPIRTTRTIYHAASLLTVLLPALFATAQANQEATKIVPSPMSLCLEWTYFIGGRGIENLRSLRSPFIDDNGVLCFTGTTQSPDFPTTLDAFDSSYNGGSQNWGLEDVFLVKFDTRQPGVAYSTFLGGARGPEHAADVFEDGSGNVYIVGNTGSSDFPTTSDALTRQFQGPVFRHADGFLAILGDGGRTLRYSTFIGGRNNDGAEKAFIEPSGEMTVFGITESPGFPSANAVQPQGLKQTAALYVMRLDATRRQVLYSRLLANSWGVDFERLDSGDFLITGTTANPDFPTTEGAYDSTYNGGTEHWRGDVFIMRLSADLKTVSFATLFGGSGEEAWPQIVTASDGDVFVFGQTTSKDLPVTVDAVEKTMEGSDALFLARFSGDGRRLRYCTYLGAKGTDVTSYAGSLVYDGASRIYLTGSTTSPDLPMTPVTIQSKPHGGYEAFLLAFDVADNSLAYGSYLGGSRDDGTPYPAFDQQGALYLIGSTNSNDFPTHQTNPAARKDEDIYISKFLIGTASAQPVRNVTSGVGYESVRDAVRDAVSGDRVEVSPGIYRESIDLSSKDITLRSVDPNDPLYIGGTIIQGDPNGPVVTLGNNSAACTLAGLTIRAASVGIAGTRAHATIRHCRIMDNLTHGLELSQDSNPHLLHCLITGNGQTGTIMTANTGGRIVTYCKPIIGDCVIVQNGQAALEGGEPNVVDSIIQD